MPRNPKSKAPKRYRPKKRNQKSKSKGTFKNKVLEVIKSQAESKQAFHSQSGLAFNSGIAAQADCLRLIPNITQGTADNNRIGDQIKPQSLKISGVLNMYNQGGTQGDGVRRLACRMMIVTPKNYPNWATAYANATTWMPYLLKKGGTTVGFTGIMSDLYCPHNSDAITLHYDKVHFLNQSGYMAIGGATSGIVSTTQENLVRFWSKTIKFGNNVKFKYDSNTDSGLTPTNAGYFLIMGYVLLDGTDVPDTATNRMWNQYITTLTYEDA